MDPGGKVGYFVGDRKKHAGDTIIWVWSGADDHLNGNARTLLPSYTVLSGEKYQNLIPLIGWLPGRLLGTPKHPQGRM